MSIRSNISKLPDWCYGMLLTDLSLIVIKVGESGYYPGGTLKPMEQQLLAKIQALTDYNVKKEQMDAFVDILNLNLKISPAVRRSMEMGSMFGWEVPGADPDAYDENGKVKRDG
jgi:hypothetical protein